MHPAGLVEEPGNDGLTGSGAQGALLILASCLPVLGAVLLAPLLPAMAHHFAATPGVSVLVPLVIGAPALLIALVSPVAGAIADRWGRKRLLLIGLPLYAVLGLLPIALDSLPLIVASRFALGAAEALIMTICTTLLGDYFRSPVRERMLSLQTVATSISAIVFVLVGGWLGAGDWRTPFWLYAVALLFAPIAAILLWEPLRDRNAGATVATAMPWDRLLPLLGLTFVGAIGFYVVPAQGAFLLERLGIAGAAEAGLVNAAAQASVLAGAASFNLLRRLGYGRAIALGFLLSAVGLAILGSATGERGVVTGAVLNGVGVGLLLPCFLAATLERLSLAQRGRGAGGFTTAFFLGQFVSPLMVLAGQQALGGLGPALWVLAVATLLCAPLALMVRGGRTSTPA